MVFRFLHIRHRRAPRRFRAGLPPAILLAALLCLAAPLPAAPAFSRDVAPIFQQHCQNCHRPGRNGPMPLLTYEETRPWVKAIRKVVAERAMPPWHADPAVGKWKNDRRMSEAEIQTILDWADGGAAPGDPADLPPPRKFVEGWSIGEPDLIVTMDHEEILPPELEDEYRKVRIKTNLAEDKWVVASEVKPSNMAVVHHVGVSAAGSEFVEYDKMAHEITVAVAGFTPGDQHIGPFTDGRGILLPAGSELVLEMHYHKQPGEEARDRTSIGFIFAREPVKVQARTLLVSNADFVIPPGAPNHEVTAEFTMPRDVRVTGFEPHMHYRGKDMRVSAVFPDGRAEDLLWVPKYDFNWQTVYEYAEPMPMPKGTRVRVVAHYDNSADNPANPDPTAEVRNGMATTTEMMLLIMGILHEGEDMTKPPVPPIAVIALGFAMLIPFGAALLLMRRSFRASRAGGNNDPNSPENAERPQSR